MKRTPCSITLATVLLFGTLVSSCVSAPVAPGPTGDASPREPLGVTSDRWSPAVEELDQYVLLIQKSSSGHITHHWRTVEEFDLSRFTFQLRAERTRGRIVLAAARQRDCHAELTDCIDTCMDRPLSEDYAHITSSGAKRAHCTKGCWQPYRDCEELQRLRPQEFSSTARAVEWLQLNRNEALVGSIVVVAGVAFLVAFPPGALIALVPVAALASSEVVCEPYITAVTP
jgi:hypothetical protein